MVRATTERANLIPSTNARLKRGRVVAPFHPSPTARHFPVPVGSPRPYIFNLRLAGFVNKNQSARGGRGGRGDVVNELQKKTTEVHYRHV